MRARHGSQIPKSESTPFHTSSITSNLSSQASPAQVTSPRRLSTHTSLYQNLATGHPVSSNMAFQQPAPPAPGAQSPATLDEMTLEMRDLVKKVQMRSHLGIEDNRIVLPKVCVVGDQSTGKSSLIEAISEIRVPRSSGTYKKATEGGEETCISTEMEKGKREREKFDYLVSRGMLVGSTL